MLAARDFSSKSFWFWIQKFYKLFNRVFIISVLVMIFSVACQTTKKTSNSASTSFASTSSAEFYSRYSKKLGVELIGNEEKKFIETITGWLGTPYIYGGKSKTGTDCSGMVQTIYKELYDISLYRSANDLVKNCDLISKNKLMSRDLVFFKIKNRKVSHVGIYIANGKFIHASSSKGVMVSDLKETYYAKYFYSGGRIKMLK